MRTVAGMEGGYSKRLQKQFRPPLSRAVTHRHRRYRYGACTKVCTGAGGSHAPTPHVAPTGGIAEETVSTRRGQEGQGTHTRCTAPFACTSCARGRRAGAPTHGVHSTVHGHCAQKWFKSSAFVRCRATEHTPGTGNHARDVQDKCMLAREPRPTRGDRVRST